MLRFLMILHGFIGVGAVFGGGAMILNPERPLGTSTELLQGSPFTDYLIPGIILFALLGVGNLVTTGAIYYQSKLYGCFSFVVSWALVIWIVVQCVIIDMIHPAHVVYFGLGLIGVMVSTFLLMNRRLFPANIFLDALSELRKVTF